MKLTVTKTTNVKIEMEITFPIYFKVLQNSLYAIFSETESYEINIHNPEQGLSQSYITKFLLGQFAAKNEDSNIIEITREEFELHAKNVSKILLEKITNFSPQNTQSNA